MRPSYLLGPALCALAMFTAMDARAQCAARLERANENASDLPADTPFQVHDELSLTSQKAEELKDRDPAGCLKEVARMEALMRRHGKTIVEASGAPAAAGTVAAWRPKTLDELFPPTDRSKRLTQLRAATGGQVLADAKALREYAEASRAWGFAVYTATMDSDPAAAAQAVSITDSAVEAAEVTQETMIQINQEGDVLHAQLEDAYRDLNAAQAAFDRFRSKQPDVLPPNFQRLAKARIEVISVTKRLEKWVERVAEEGFAPGYLGAIRLLEVRYRPKFKQIDDQCEKMREEAYVKMVKAGMAGGKSTAVQDAAAACSKLNEPVEKQRQREEAEINKKYRLPKKRSPEKETLNDLTDKFLPDKDLFGGDKPPAGAKSPEAAKSTVPIDDDDLLAPLVPPEAAKAPPPKPRGGKGGGKPK